MAYKDKDLQKKTRAAYHQKMKSDIEYQTKRRKVYLFYIKRHRLLTNKRARTWVASEKGQICKENYREISKKLEREYTENLTERYMKKHLKKLGYSTEDIKKYPELIDTYKLIIKTKRLCKSQTSKI